MPAAPRRSALRTAVFAVLPAVALFVGANWLVEYLERQELVDTRLPDDNVQFVEGDLFEVESGPHYVTTSYAESSLVPSRFPVDKGDGWRMFLTGGSFVQGSPYTHQGHGVEFPGGIASWLRLDLAAQHPDRRLDIVNLAAGGQGSYRVRTIVEDTLSYQPDVYFVATCNNEGALSPSLLQAYLHGLGGYRLLRKYLREEPGTPERSLFTLQDPDTKELALQFRMNIEGIAQATEMAGVPLILATLPIHRSWTGNNVSNPLGMQMSVEEPDDPCIRELRSLFEEGKFERVVERAPACEYAAEALRWSGLSLANLRRPNAARVALDQSVELLPRNRCRPSFNRIIREVAAGSDNTHLLDLDELARATDRDGLPGQNLFIDYCHLTHRGYAWVADELRKRLTELGLAPPGGAADSTVDRERVIRRTGLDRIRWGDAD